MDSKKVLATVGYRQITEEDVQRLMSNFNPQMAAQFSSEEGKKRLIEELISQELFYLDAVDKKMDQEEEFKAELEKAKVDLLKQYALNKLLSSVRVSETEVLAFYKENTSQFKNGESVRASHILVNTEDEAAGILKKINGGLSFEEAAKEYSNCPSKEQGGDLGYFTKGRMVPEFEAAAFNMKVGEISSPVRTQFGYHLIKLLDKKKEQASSYEDVRDQIAQQFFSEKQQEAYFNKVNELKEIYYLKIEE